MSGIIALLTVLVEGWRCSVSGWEMEKPERETKNSVRISSHLLQFFGHMGGEFLADFT